MEIFLNPDSRQLDRLCEFSALSLEDLDEKDRLFCRAYEARWKGLLRVETFNCQTDSYLIVYLPVSVEAEIDKVWLASPYQGWLLTLLAQRLCLGSIQKVLGKRFCLPLPPLTPALQRALSDRRIPCNGEAIALRFALFTFDVLKEQYNCGQAACKRCALLAKCPRKL